MGNYSYVKIGNYYFNAEAKKLEMALCLGFKLKPLNLIDGKSKFPLPEALMKLYRIIRFMVHLYTMANHKQTHRVQLPVYGQVALYSKRRNVYKVFDAENGTVATFIPRSIEKTDDESSSLLEKVGEAGIGPKIMSTNIDQYFYREELLNFAEAEACNAKDVHLFIQNVIRTFPMKKIGMRTYILSFILDLPEEFKRNMKAHPKINEINAYLHKMRDKLLQCEDQYVHLAFSHGDVHFGNLVYSDRGMIGIDWEFSGWRSLLYDTLFFAFKTTNQVEIDSSSFLLDNVKTALLQDDEATDINTELYVQLFYFEYAYHWFQVLCESYDNLSTEETNRFLDWVLKDLHSFENMESYRRCEQVESRAE